LLQKRRPVRRFFIDHGVIRPAIALPHPAPDIQRIDAGEFA
jgi:hypothetical protein